MFRIRPGPLVYTYAYSLGLHNHVLIHVGIIRLIPNASL